MYKNVFYILLLATWVNLGFGQKNVGLEIRKLIKYETNLEYGRQNGFHISIIDYDTSIMFKIGHIDTASHQLYEIGSVTKVFTASLMAKLVKQKYFKLSDPVNKYLPTNFSNPRLDYLKIADLLEQKSGLPKRPNDFGRKEIYMQNPYANYLKYDLLRFYRDFVPNHDNYGSYQFSHTNYALLEVIIENATQEKYEDLLNKYIFEPLGMKDSYIDLSEYVQEHMAIGQDRSGEIVSPWEFRSFAASNGMKTTAYDLSKFVLANIYSTEYDMTHEKKIKSNFNTRIYGASGWHIVDKEAKYDILTTSGKSSGHQCTIAFIKETKTGVIVISNNAFGSENLALLILRMINDNWTKEKEKELNN